jgi:hypothetical protein
MFHVPVNTWRHKVIDLSDRLEPLPEKANLAVFANSPTALAMPQALPRLSNKRLQRLG